MKEVKYEDLNSTQQLLLEGAELVMDESYNPYSKFSVGAALLDTNGEIICGTNVENASYGLTICAERSAIVKANSMGIRTFDKLAIISKGVDFDTTEVSAPCGACRQVLYEFSQLSGINMEIILSTTNKDKIIITSINELLPLAFGPIDLLVDVEKYK